MGIKTILVNTAVLMAIVSCGQTAEAKKAVLVCHYGSSNDDTRSRTIDLITSDIAVAMDGYEVREAYISPVVRRSMAARNLHIDSPTDALLRLRADGYDTVYVQSTTLIDGAETAEVRLACERTGAFFSKIKCGEPLCYSPCDCEALVSILAEEPCGKGEAVVYAGHGNMLPSTATYCMLDYMLAAKGHDNYHVSTIEGYPSARCTVGELRRNKNVRRVKLVPLLLVCGNHTKGDIAVDFAGELSAEGYETETVMRGLAENAAVRALYVNKVRRLTGEHQ